MSDVPVSGGPIEYYDRGEETFKSTFIFAINIEMTYATYDVNIRGPKQMLDLPAKSFPGRLDIVEKITRIWRVKYVFFCFLINKISNQL